jgi:opine dehydrogenase
MTTFAIIGAGNAGCAFAAHLKLLGHETRLHDVFEQQLAPLWATDNVIELGGNLELPGFQPGELAQARVDYVGNDLATAIDGADLILCTAPAHTHRAIASDLAALVKSDQIVVLNPGRTCGAIEVVRIFREQNAAADITVVEAQTLLYACRRDKASVHVFGIKDRVACAAIPDDQLDRFLEPMQAAIPQFVRAEQGIWETSLDNIGMLFHPTPTLFNLARMETGERFDYYIDGMSPTVANIVEKLDVERCRVAAAMGVDIPTAVQWLKITYGAEGANLHEAVQNNSAYKGIQAPQLNGVDAKRGLRYVVEDVPTGLVPVSELGNKLGVPTPTIDLIIDVANTIYDRDFRAAGRTLERLGLADLSVEQLKAL